MDDLYMKVNTPSVALISKVVSDVTYMAEAPPETSHTTGYWVCSRIENVSATITVIQVKREQQIPGTNGANFASIWGD